MNCKYSFLVVFFLSKNSKVSCNRKNKCALFELLAREHYHLVVSCDCHGKKEIDYCRTLSFHSIGPPCTRSRLGKEVVYYLLLKLSSQIQVQVSTISLTFAVKVSPLQGCPLAY